MAKLEDLISEVADARLREEVAREVASLKKQKFVLGPIRRPISGRPNAMDTISSLLIQVHRRV